MKLSVEYVKVDTLSVMPDNAKIHTSEQIEQIKNSIVSFGFNDPIAVYGDDNTIVEGHGRFLAAKELGLDVVPIIRLDGLSDEQIRAYSIVHNQLTMNTGFDPDLLLQELENISLYNMQSFGFDDVNVFDDFDPSVFYEDEKKIKVVCRACGKEFYLDKSGGVSE